MKNGNRAIEFEMLISEAQAIGVEVMGMKYENEQRIHLGESMAYTEDFFRNKAEEIRMITDKLRVLKV